MKISKSNTVLNLDTVRYYYRQCVCDTLNMYVLWIQKDSHIFVTTQILRAKREGLDSVQPGHQTSLQNTRETTN